MRRILFLFLFAALTLSAADFSGKWAGELKKIKGGPDGPDIDEHYLVLEQKGTTITGTAGPRHEVQWEIQNVKLDGSKLTFEVVVPDAGWKISYALELAGEKLTGKLSTKDGPQIEASLAFARE